MLSLTASVTPFSISDPIEAKGPVTGLHPGSRMHFIQMLSTFRGEDWEYVYEGSVQNRFGYLGNGFTMKEVELLKAAKQS